MEIYKISKKVYKYYCKNVKGNNKLRYDLVQRKLSRNIESSIKVPVKGNKIIYLYGNLHIHTKGNRIIKLKNHRVKNDWFYLNNKKKVELNKKYGISNTSQWKEVGDLNYITEYAKGF